MKEHEEGYSMPLAAPTFTKPPFYATPDSRILMMAYRADPESPSPSKCRSRWSRSSPT